VLAKEYKQGIEHQARPRYFENGNASIAVAMERRAVVAIENWPVANHEIRAARAAH
jgi:hypothetical protein